MDPGRMLSCVSVPLTGQRLERPKSRVRILAWSFCTLQFDFLTLMHVNNLAPFPSQTREMRPNHRVPTPIVPVPHLQPLVDQ